MDNTRAQQKALDDELVAPANLALDVLKLTPFYNTFKISVDVLEIYMQEFWVTVSRHHSSLRFKLNGKKPLEEEILSFIRDLGHTEEIKFLSDVNVNHMHQPWRSFAAIINKCLSGKTTALESLRLLLHGKGSGNPKEKQDVLVTLTEAQQMKIAIERSKIQTHSSHASGLGDGVDIQSKVPHEQQQNVSGTNEGAGDKLEVPGVPEYRAESEEESWTYSQGEDDEDNDKHDSENDNDDEDDDQENVSGETESDNDGDDFVHPNLSTYKADDQEEEKEEEKANDDEDVSSDQMVSTPTDYEIIEEEENQKDDDNVVGGEQEDEEDEELYGDLNLNLERRDAEMMMLKLIKKRKRVSSLETELSELKQTNQFAKVVSSISGIVDNYLMSKMKDVVNVVVQLKSNKLREEAQTENDEFLKQIDSNIKTIIKDQVKAQVSKIMPRVEKYVTESLGAEVLAISSNQPQTSYAAVASLSEFELKKILIDKIKENKSMNRSDIQKNLYITLIESYNSNKDLFPSYGDVVTLKRGRNDQDKEEEPSAGSNRGIKQKRSGKEESSKEATQKESKSTSSSKGASGSQPKSSGKSAQAEEHGIRVDDLEEPLHQEFNTRNDDISHVREIIDVDERLWNLLGSQTPDRTQSLFNEFVATLIDISAFITNRLKLNNLAQDVLTGPTYDLMKGTCKSVVELKYHLEEVFKVTNDQLDWHNPEGRPYPYDLSKTLPLNQNARGRQVIPFDYFINNDLEYLKGGSLSQKYTTSLTKIKATDYGHVKWIEDKVHRSIWSLAQVVYDKHAYWGTYH
ncbi:hypothetical protein Tco_1023270 [Tanacetum coccineum]